MLLAKLQITSYKLTSENSWSLKLALRKCHLLKLLVDVDEDNDNDDDDNDDDNNNNNNNNASYFNGLRVMSECVTYVWTSK